MTAEEINKALLLAERGQLLLASKNRISFQRKSDIRFTDETLDEHPNALRLTAYDSQGEAIQSESYFSVGGGFVQTLTKLIEVPQTSMQEEPYLFESFKDLLALCLTEGLSISRVMLENEEALRHRDSVQQQCMKLYRVMRNCVDVGTSTQGHFRVD